jgi:hypothetical protein
MAIEQPLAMTKSFTGSPMTFSVLGETVAAEADVRVMDFCLGKPTDFLNNRTVLWMRWAAGR